MLRKGPPGTHPVCLHYSVDASLLSSPFETDKPCYQKGPSKGPTTALFRFEAQAGFQAHSKNNNNINSNKYWEQKNSSNNNSNTSNSNVNSNSSSKETVAKTIVGNDNKNNLRGVRRGIWAVHRGTMPRTPSAVTHVGVSQSQGGTFKGIVGVI